MTLELRPLEDSDIPVMADWLTKDHVGKWYHDPQEWLREMRERNGEFAFLHHFMVYDKCLPFGFGQYYDCYDAREEWYEISVPGELYSIDYMIGDENYLGKGYGKAIVAALIDRIKSTGTAKMVIAEPDPGNLQSCGVLVSNGFTFDPRKNYYELTINY